MDLSNYKDKVVLVTGGTGFVGTNLCAALVSAGALVHAIHKNESTPIKQIANVSYHTLNVNDLEKLANFLKTIKPNYIFHLAADIDRKRDVEQFRESTTTNLIGLLNILQTIVSLGYRMPLILAGTAEEYGDRPVPFREDVQEKPVSPYSFSKVASTYLARTFYSAYSLPIVILRPTIAYGPNQKGDMFIPSLIRALSSGNEFKMTKGEQTRDFIFIDDLIEAYLLAGLSAEKLAGETINIGYGHPHKLKEVAKKIGELMGKPDKIMYGASPYRIGEVMQYFVDNSKAKRMLGWKPRTDLEKGLGITMANLDKHD